MISGNLINKACSKKPGGDNFYLYNNCIIKLADINFERYNQIKN